MRTMYDAVNVAAIPRDASMIALYGDGAQSKNYDIATKAVKVNGVWVPIHQQFPNLKTLVVIATSAYLHGANVYDCENGDFTPTQVAEVVSIAHGNGEHPTVYCSLDAFGAVDAAFKARGIEAWLMVWVADWDGSPILHAGTYATQYANPTIDHAGYDISVCTDYWPGVDPVPTPPQPVSPQPPQPPAANPQYLFQFFATNGEHPPDGVMTFATALNLARAVVRDNPGTVVEVKTEVE